MRKLFALESGLEILLHILTSKTSSQFKQQALLFDSIGILRLAPLIEAFDIVDADKKTFSNSLIELKWLIDKGIIFEPVLPSGKLETLLATTLGNSYATNYREVDNEIKKLIDKREKTSNIESEFSNLFAPMVTKDSIVLRLLSATMDKNDNLPIITTLFETGYSYELTNAKKRDVIRVVLNKLPLPDNMTPWEKIIDYRDDPDNQKNLLGLRRWIRKISTKELSKAEIEDEIEWQINEFQRHMKYHKIKANTETLEVLVKAPLEIIENLVKLKLSKLPEPFFAVQKRKLMLMEAEMNNPSKELAYIIKSREAFSLKNSF